MKFIKKQTKKENIEEKQVEEQLKINEKEEKGKEDKGGKNYNLFSHKKRVNKDIKEQEKQNNTQINKEDVMETMVKTNETLSIDQINSLFLTEEQIENLEMQRNYLKETKSLELTLEDQKLIFESFENALTPEEIGKKINNH